MNVKDVYINENRNDIVIVTKFTKKVAKELLEGVLGIDVVVNQTNHTSYDLVLRTNSIYYYKELPKVLATKIPWSKLIAITIDTKAYKISIDTDYKKINDYFRNFEDNMEYEAFMNYLYKSVKLSMEVFKRNVECTTEVEDDYFYYLEDAIKFCLENPNRTAKDLFEFSRDYEMYWALEDWDYTPSAKAAEFYMFLGAFETAIEPYRKYLSML